MGVPRRRLTVALALVIAFGVAGFGIDITTIRISPDLSLPKSTSYQAFPGELMSVELSGRWTAARSSDPAVVVPLGGNWFAATRPGSATLSAVTIRCAGCAMATYVWRANIQVGPGP